MSFGKVVEGTLEREVFKKKFVLRGEVSDTGGVTGVRAEHVVCRDGRILWPILLPKRDELLKGSAEGLDTNAIEKVEILEEVGCNASMHRRRWLLALLEKTRVRG